MIRAAKVALRHLTSRERWVFVVLVSCRALASFLDLAGIVLIGLIAAAVGQQLSGGSGSSSAVTAFGLQMPVLDTGGLLALAALALAVFVVKAVLAVSLSKALTNFDARVELRNSHELAVSLMRGSLEHMKRYSKGEYQWALTSSSNFGFTWVLNNLATIGSEGFLLIVLAAAFVVVNPIAAVFAFVYFAVVIVVMQFLIERSLRRAGKQTADGTVGVNDIVSDSIDAYREIAVLGRQDPFVARIDAARATVARGGATIAFLGGMPRYIVETALLLGVVVLVAFQLLSGDVANGLATLGVFLTGGVRMMASLLPLQGAVSNLHFNFEQATLAYRMLDEIKAAPAPEPVEPVPGEVINAERRHGLGVVLRDASYRYDDGDDDAIRGVGFELAPGSYTAIIGPSGAGKTTLVDLLLGLVAPRTGEVLIDGYPPAAIRAAAPGLLAYVPQKPGLVAGTIAENIALGSAAGEIDRARLLAAADAAHVTEFVAGLPDGFDTSVGKQVDSLRGGQIQRIGLARALYARPRLLILDEATSALDASSEAIIGRSLAALHGEVTVVVIAHRLSSVQHADEVIVVEHGGITARGDFDSVRSSVPMVAEYVKLMSFSPTAA